MRMHRIVICDVSGLTSFSTLFHKRHDSAIKAIEHKMWVLIFSTTFVWNISHSKKNSVRRDEKCELVYMLSTRYFCEILIKLEFFSRIF